MGFGGIWAMKPSELSYEEVDRLLNKIDELKKQVKRLKIAASGSWKAFDSLPEYPSEDEWLEFSDAVYMATRGLFPSDIDN